MSEYQFWDDDDFTDFELERAVLATSDHPNHGTHHWEEKRRTKHEREQGDKHRDREPAARKVKQGGKYRDMRDLRGGQQTTATFLEQGRRATYTFDIQTKKRDKKDHSSQRRIKRAERTDMISTFARSANQPQLQRKGSTERQTSPPPAVQVDRVFASRLCHSDSELDISPGIKKTLLGKCPEPNKKITFAKSLGRSKEHEKHGQKVGGAAEAQRLKSAGLQADYKSASQLTGLGKRRNRTKSSPELRDTSVESCLECSLDHAIQSPSDASNQVIHDHGMVQDRQIDRMKVGLRPYPRENGFRAKMFQLLIQQVKDLTKELQEHKEIKKKLSAQILILEGENKSLRDRLKQADTLSFRKRQNKRLDETINVIKEEHATFSRGSFKRDLRNILAEVQGKYCAQLREHELRIQEVQEKAEHDIHDLMKNIVEKYVRVTEIKERQQEIEKMVLDKSEDVSPGAGELTANKSRASKNPAETLSLPMTIKNSAPVAIEAGAKELLSKNKPYQFYFSENRARSGDNGRTTRELQADFVQLSPRAVVKETPILAAGSSNLIKSSTSKSNPDPVPPRKDSPVSLNTYQYWHARLTQGVKDKTSTLRNAS